MTMMMRTVLACAMTLAAGGAFEQVPRSGNPILPGWYADPEAHVFDGQYWIFPTYSAPYDAQTIMDAFSSRDLVTWTKHPRVLDMADISWGRRARATAGRALQGPSRQAAHRRVPQRRTADRSVRLQGS